MIPKLSTQQPWGYNVKPLPTMLQHVEARLHSYTWIDKSYIRVRAEGKHTSIPTKKEEKLKTCTAHMLSYPWSLAQGTISTAFNNRSCLTPSNNAQSLPKQLLYMRAVPSQLLRPDPQSLRRAWTPSTSMRLPAKSRCFKVRFSFKASASTWRSAITTGAATVLMPPSQPASKIEMFSSSNHWKMEGSGTKICHRFILVPEMTAMSPVTPYLETE